MNTLDILIIVILAVSIIYSFSKGLIKEICSLFAVVIGLFIASKTYLLVAKPLMELVHNWDGSLRCDISELFVGTL